MKTDLNKIKSKVHRDPGFDAFRLPLTLTGVQVAVVISAILIHAKPEIAFSTDRGGTGVVVGLVSDFVTYLTSLL